MSDKEETKLVEEPIVDSEPKVAELETTTKSEDTEASVTKRLAEDAVPELKSHKSKKKRRRNYDDEPPLEDDKSSGTEDEDVDDDKLVVEEDEEEDDMLEIDTTNIITTGRRTRGKVVDYTKVAEELSKEGKLDDEDEDDEFNEPVAK